MSCLLGNHKLRTPASGWVGKGGWGQHRCKISQEAPSPHLYGHAPPQRRAESGRDCRTASSQVAAYGGKLRYTLSYTAAPQSSPLSDPDIQITVSTWIPCQAGSRGSQSASSVCLFFQFSTRLAWHGLVGGGGGASGWTLPRQRPRCREKGTGGMYQISWAHEPGRLERCEAGVMGRGWDEWRTPLSVPLSILLASPQGNNIMLVASQPALQGPERKSYEIVLREVKGTWPPCV